MSFGLPKRIFFDNPDEVLTGQVQGKPASDIEERSTRAIDKLPEWSYTFQVAINPITGYLSEEKTHLINEVEIDIFARRGDQYVAILVDGEIGHFYAAWQRDADAEKTDRINAFMHQIGQGDAVRVEFWRLADQQMANKYYRELLI